VDVLGVGNDTVGHDVPLRTQPDRRDIAFGPMKGRREVVEHGHSALLQLLAIGGEYRRCIYRDVHVARVVCAHEFAVDQGAMRRQSSSSNVWIIGIVIRVRPGLRCETGYGFYDRHFTRFEIGRGKSTARWCVYCRLKRMHRRHRIVLVERLEGVVPAYPAPPCKAEYPDHFIMWSVRGGGGITSIMFLFAAGTSQ